MHIEVTVEKCPLETRRFLLCNDDRRDIILVSSFSYVIP